jgi:hypothetical protein
MVFSTWVRRKTASRRLAESYQRNSGLSKQSGATQTGGEEQQR